MGDDHRDLFKGDKIERILSIYTRLLNGGIVNKTQEAQHYGVNERSIQRDIDDIRNFFDQEAAEDGYTNQVIYDRFKKGYRLEQIYRMKFTNAEILAICKILLDSRAFTKPEMEGLIDKLISGCVPVDNQKLAKELVANEEYHYVELQNKKPFLEDLWEIGSAIKNNQFIEIKYQGVQGSTVKTRKLKPLAIMFSEFYFYLVAFIDDERVRENFDVINDSFPTIYRIDRIQGLKVLDEKFHIPYASRFEEGEFRKRIQFMFGGKLQRVRFKYTGPSVEAVLDRLPTAVIEQEEEGIYSIKAEVFGKGIDMWLRSQGENVSLIGDGQE